METRKFLNGSSIFSDNGYKDKNDRGGSKHISKRNRNYTELKNYSTHEWINLQGTPMKKGEDRLLSPLRHSR